MDNGQQLLAAQLKSIEVEAGPMYVERDDRPQETDWVATKIGLCDATLGKDGQGAWKTLAFHITPWAAIGEVKITGSGVLPDPSGPSELEVAIPDVGLDAKVTTSQRLGKHVGDRNELAAFVRAVLEDTKRVRP